MYTQASVYCLGKNVPQHNIIIPLFQTKKGLTLQLYLQQSFQKLRTENFLRMTTVEPNTSINPMPTIPPAEWYNGRGS